MQTQNEITASKISNMNLEIQERFTSIEGDIKSMNKNQEDMMKMMKQLLDK